MAKEKGEDYIDLSPIFWQHKTQYGEDGSHFTNACYPNPAGLMEGVDGSSSSVARFGSHRYERILQSSVQALS